jgi:hypothetical protein
MCVRVFPMYEERYADKFGFTDDKATVIIQHHDMGNYLEESSNGMAIMKSKLYIHGR